MLWAVHRLLTYEAAAKKVGGKHTTLHNHSNNLQNSLAVQGLSLLAKTRGDAVCMMHVQRHPIICVCFACSRRNNHPK